MLAVKHNPSFRINDYTSDDTALWIRINFVRSSHPSLSVAVCYVPPQGSVRLAHCDLQARMQGIADAALAVSLLPVIVAGDLNSHVPPENGHGRALARMCQDTGLQVQASVLGTPRQHPLSGQQLE